MVPDCDTDSFYFMSDDLFLMRNCFLFAFLKVLKVRMPFIGLIIFTKIRVIDLISWFEIQVPLRGKNLFLIWTMQLIISFREAIETLKSGFIFGLNILKTNWIAFIPTKISRTTTLPACLFGFIFWVFNTPMFNCLYIFFDQVAKAIPMLFSPFP